MLYMSYTVFSVFKLQKEDDFAEALYFNPARPCKLTNKLERNVSAVNVKLPQLVKE